MNDTLPEGTDQIIPGATNNATRPPIDAPAASGGDDVVAGLRDKVGDLRDQATEKASDAWSKYRVGDKAMEFAETGKVRASGALDEVARMIGETAGKLDEQVGSGYGDYVRKAADAVSGASSTLRDKSVDELLDDARGLVRQSPAVAIGVATALGFAFARILKAGGDALEQTARDAAAKTGGAVSGAASEVVEAVKSAAKSTGTKPDSDA